MCRNPKVTAEARDTPEGSPLRILLAHSFYRVPGGEDGYVNAQAELLSTRHEVDVLAMQNAELTSGFRTAMRMTLSLREAKRVRTRLEKFKPHVINLHNPYPALGPAVHLAAKRQDVPLVMTVHNLRLRCPNGLMFTQGAPCRRCEGGNYSNAILHRCFSSPTQSATYAMALWTHRFLLRLEHMITTFIAPSVFIRDQLHQWGIARDHVALVHNFVPQVPAPSVAPGKFGIYVGRLSAEKGIDVLLRALSTAGDPPFLIVGDGPLGRDSMAMARALRLQRTEFAGRLSAQEVSAKLSDARFLVMPSLCDENAPLAVLEAMAHGCPVLVTRRGGLPELAAGGGGLMSEAGDERELAANIMSLMANDQMCTALSRQALETARKQFTPGAHLLALEKVYRGAIARSEDRAAYESRQR